MHRLKFSTRVFKIAFLFIAMFVLVCPIFAAESEYKLVSSDSILKWLSDDSLEEGYYRLTVSDQEYEIHLYVYDKNQHWSADQSFGDANDVATASDYAKHMVAVKVNGDLTIDSGVKVTAYGSSYGGPKGLTLYVTGKLTNNGTIHMSSRGAKAIGENVYLWKNSDNTYEFVPKDGAAAKADVSGYGGATGNDGSTKAKRATASGGTGASRISSTLSGNSGAGSSYSGGPGSGATSVNGTSSVAASGNGGAGGAGRTNSTSTSYYVGGGAGNPGGGTNGGTQSVGQKGSNGTGGLLNIYAHEYENNGSISANGASGGNAYNGGGSSGGGSINIFIDNNTGIDQTGIVTSDRYKEILGNVVANGGAAAGTNYKGGAGGTGTVNIGEIRNGQYYDLKEIIEQEKEAYANNVTIAGDSILSILQTENLNSGYYNFLVNGVNYPVHMYVMDGNQVWSTNQTFGDARDVATLTPASLNVSSVVNEAKNMVIVKVNGNLTINEGVTVTTYNTVYGGPKGFFMYVSGTLTNNGTISMSNKGAYAKGQDVYLWHNTDGTYETVPSVGASGGTGASSLTGNPGKAGSTKAKRATAGGGSGASRNSGTLSGTGGSGTSYSGGVGSGATSLSGTSSAAGNNVGGAGGAGLSNSTSSTYYVGGGAGNPGGATNGGTANVGTVGSNGTGGLLNIYAHEYKNNGTITSNGANGGNAYSGGGSSGGGSINIFIENDTGIDQTGIITETRYQEIKGSVVANGGSSVGTSRKSGAGGTGTINIGEIRNGQYYDLREIIDQDKETYANGKTIGGDSILSILQSENLNTGYYNFYVNGKNYPVHMYVLNGNQVWSTNQVFGDEIDVATASTESQNMVIVKVNGSLTINSGVTVTAYKNIYGGPKGFFLYVKDTLTNNGEITMSNHGAKATGEDVYLWHNTDGTYEVVPGVGASGGPSSANAIGKAGTNGSLKAKRATGGGGSGASKYAGSSSGVGGAGTSYSGGSGSGATSVDGQASSNAPNNGGQGSAANVTNTNTSYLAGGGAGNPGGTGSVAGANGTGGLLNIYAREYKNNGTISSNGASGGSTTNGGGSSGGGSINIFIENDTGIDQTGIITDTRYEEIKGATSVNGGSAVGSTKAGGKGGNGTVNIGIIRKGQYYDLKEAINQDIEDFTNGQSIKGDSILSILKEKDLKDGYYNFVVNGEEYPVHLFNFDSDQVWSGDKVFGDETDVATASTESQNMIVVKVNGNLTINSGTTVSAFGNTYGGPKGLTLYVTGTLTNNGVINMSGHGAKATGQNVYLWHNKSGSYEYVPALGAAAVVDTNVQNGVSGASGSTKGKRATGSGGTGASRYANTLTGNSGAGTSYSGGSGSGATSTDGSRTGAASSIGGAGSNAVVYSTTQTAGGGAGNPGGTGTAYGTNGTGGLLNIYAHEYKNNGTISANGANGGNAKYGGGSSGGGSINIFIDNDTGITQTGIITDTRYKEILGNVVATGGASLGATYKGGAGGAGTVNIGKIIDNEYYDLKDAINQDIEDFENNNTVKGDSILAILKEKNLSTGYYKFEVNDEVYGVHLYSFDRDQNWNSNQTFGDAMDVGTSVNEAQNMVIVKVNGNVQIGSGTTISAFKNEFGGPKGFLLYVTGTLKNNGEITATGLGAKAAGQNVYLWHNQSGSYEYVPRTGAAGGASVAGTNVGKPGGDGTKRGTGGGGSGSARSSSSISGAGGTGTSYSGGTGGGSNTSGANTAGTGSSIGGNGGNALTSTSTNATYQTAGGVGNPGGTGTAKGANGTGGLLTIYAENYINNGTITSHGITNTTKAYSGGSSGGGSINLFINNDTGIDKLGIVTEHRYQEIKGNVAANGGSAVGSTKVGGKGGNGTFNIGKIIDGEYYDLKDAINKDIENFKNNSTIEGTSILEIVSRDIFDGYYNFKVNDETYPVHLITYNGDQVWSGDKVFGDANDVASSISEAQNMVIVKVIGDLTVSNGTTVTAFSNEYGGPKGFLLYVSGILTNNGTISMTAKGAKATSQNVYLWQNNDKTYEFVPKVGSGGGASVSGTVIGKPGVSGMDRGTGGGGSGASRGASSKSGIGSYGTSYSGGTGGGANSLNSGAAGNGSAIGGNGGNSLTGTSASYTTSGGVGNPSGSGSYQSPNGTGGLLTIFANKYRNNGVVSAAGVTAASANYGGGSSGGGSINIFYTSELVKGTTNVKGGAASGTSKAGGAGGSGTVTYKEIVLENELLAPTLKTLTVDKGVMTPTFESLVYEYDVVLDKEDYKVNIDATVTKAGNKVTAGIGEFDIPSGTSVHNVVVTSAAGNINIYKINFTRQPNSIDYLNGIKINDKEIDGFKKDKYEYNINLDYTFDEFDLSVIVGSTSQKIYGTGKITTNSGKNTFYIDVESEDGTGKQQYKLNIFRDHSSKLKSLSFGEYTLEPSFEPELYDYTLNMLSSAMSLSPVYQVYDEEAEVALDGFGYIKSTRIATITVTEPNVAPTTYKVKVIKGNLDDIGFEYSCNEGVQEFEAPLSGNYLVELWGAQGGYGRTNNSWTRAGGLGAYTSGTIYLEKGTKFYVYVGCQGKDGGKVVKYIGGLGGYNGGANGGNDSNTTETSPDPGGGGGGATDIRILNGSWDNFDSLKSRIMVAAGGGGGTYSYNGYAGGINRNKASNTYQFGRGQNGFTAANGSGGGAGGYFGGSSNQASNGYGYGGTSYISGNADFYAINKNATSSNISLSSSSVHESGYQFKDSVHFNGTQKMPSKTTGYSVGNSGDGFARIARVQDLSSNNFLSFLQVKYKDTVKDLTPEFKPEITEYTLNLDVSETHISVLAKQDDPLALLSGDGEYDIAAGDTDIKISVVAQDNTEKTYILHVNRPASSDAYPKDIFINGLVPSLCSAHDYYCVSDPTTFDKDTDTYTMTVPSKIKQVYFTVTKGHDFQTVSGDGKVDLGTGENTIVITVTSEDKSATTTYTYKIERDMTGNNDLASIEILDPVYDIGFNSGVTEYYLSVPNDYTEIKQMEITTEDPEASYVVSGNEDFIIGDNVVTITVTAKNGDIKIYTLNVYREKSGNTFLSNLQVMTDTKEYDLSPAFNKAKRGIYLVTVPNDVDKINIVATPEHAVTKVAGDGEHTLSTGTNPFSIVMTAEDGSIETYNVTITREKNNNADLASITVKDDKENSYTLNETFNKDTLKYTVDVLEGTTKIKISATTEVSTSSYKLLDSETIVVGENVKRILVVAEDGTTKTYEITVRRSADTNNYLKSITTSNGTLAPVFEKTTQKYMIEVENDVKNITITGEKDSEYASLKGNGTYSLGVGDNTITLTVTAEDKTTRDYEILVRRSLNSNAYLKNITSSMGTLSPTFNQDTFAYSINVENDIDAITLTGVPEVSTTKVSGDGTFTLVSGENTFTITTLAEDKESTETYVVHVFRDKSANDNLSNLIVKEGILSPTFDPNIVSYTVTIPYEFDEVHVLAELESKYASYVVTGEKNLVVGENEVVVEVTSESGHPKPYTITVIRQEQETSNNYLKSLTAGEESLEPDFDKHTPFYEVTVPNDVTSITVLAEAEDDAASVTGVGPYLLQVGENLVSIRVEGTDGKTRDYQILITREKSSEARLANMVISGLTIQPKFDKDTYFYTTETTNTSLVFTSIVTLDKKATYEILNNSFTEVGDHTVTVRVTAEDGVTTEDYEILVTKTPSANNNLSSLSVDDYTISPNFDKSKTNYTLTVPNEVNSIFVRATAEDAEATVTGTGVVDIDVGRNEIVVEVTSGKGTKKSYTIVVTKQGSDNNYIKTLDILNGTLQETFEKEKNSYNVTVPYEETSLSLNVVLESPTASYIVNNNTLNVGKNTVTIVVTSESGKVNVYTLNVQREEINSALLKTLEIKNYNMSPAFSSNVLHYTVTIDNEITALDFTKIETLDPKATYKISGNSDFVIGENVVTIEVTASDTTTKETYYLFVNRQQYSNTYLDYLYTSLGDVTPDFEKETLSYSIDVANSDSEIEIFAEAIDASATVTGTGLKTLKTGENKFSIVVKTTTGITRTYNLTVNRAKDSNKDLTSLRVMVGGLPQTLTPDFDKDTLTYEVTVPVGTEEIVINAIPVKTTSKVTGSGKQTIVLGENTKVVTVTAEDGTFKEYTLKITRPASDNSKLTSLTPSNGLLSPSFTYEYNTYTLDLDSATTNLSFSYTTEDKNAVVTGVSEELVPDGTSIRTITVTAEDGISTSTYVVTVNKERTDNALLSNLTVNGYTLTPSFDKETFTYYLTVPNSKQSLLSGEVIATPDDKNAKVYKDSNVGLSTTEDATYNIVVTAPNGYTTNTYQIIVTRGKSDITGLKSLHVLTGKLDKPFNETDYEYNWTIPKSVTTVDESLIRYLLNDAKSTVTITPAFTVETKVIYDYSITVTSEDGKNTVTYTLHVAHELSDVSSLSSLEIDKGYYEPNFNAKIYEYDVYEYSDITELEVTVTLSDTFATVIGDGTVLLTEDEMDHDIIVTAEDGSVTTYTLHIHRNISNEKYLKDLIVEDLDKVTCATEECVLSPSFEAEHENYAITVPYEYETLKLLAETMSEEQSVKIKVGGKEVSDYKLPTGKTEVTIEVYDGMNTLTKTYTLSITRSLSRNNYLESLEVAGYELDPEFDKEKLEYSMTILEDIDEITVDAIPEDEHASVNIENYHHLVEGTNVVTITVTSVNGDERVYKINVTKASKDNSYLKNITVSSGTFYELDPEFDKETYTYKITVDDYVDEVLVEATPDLEATKVEGVGEVTLKDGVTTVNIVTTSPKGKISIYKINITKNTNRSVNLKSLTVDEGTLSPEFSKNTVSYTMDVADTVESLTIHATPEDKDATVRILGNNNFVQGENKVSIVVTNKDKTASKTYTITVNKKGNSDLELKGIEVYKVEDDTSKTYFDLTPAFSNTISTYKANVGDENKVTLDAKASSEKTVISGLGEFYLNYGDNIKDITVTAEDGSVATYQVNLYRGYNLYLKELETDEGTLSPAFDKDTTSYTLNLKKDVDEVYVSASTESSLVNITSGVGIHPVSDGDTISVVVTSPDDKTKTYTITVNKEKSNNNFIKELVVHEGVITPKFDKETDTYSTSVRSIFDHVGLTIHLEDEKASYKVIDNSSLTVGVNTITIEVTAENGEVRKYYLNVTLEEDNEYSARLRSLETSVGTLNPTFDPDKNYYEINVDQGVSKLTLSAIKEDEYASVVGTGEKALKSGENIYQLVVTNRDKSRTNTYTVVVNREKSNDATLKSLEVTGKSYYPIFNRLEENYTMYVDSSIKDLNVVATPTEADATVKITGNKDLKTGENKILITVTAPDEKTTKTYTITVNKSADTNNYLSQLEVVDYPFDKTFTKTDQGPYTITVSEDVNNIQIVATPDKETTKINGDGSVTLSSGMNILSVTATSENGDVRTYTIIVLKVQSDDATLKEIKLSEGALDPTFDRETTSYTVSVPSDTESITITGIPTNPKSTVVGNKAYTLTNDKTTVTLQVTSEKGTTKEYIIVIQKESIHSSKIKELAIKEGALDPEFNKNTENYTVLIPNDVDALSMLITLEDENATYVVNDNHDLELGSNTITIVVTSDDGSDTTTYTINAIKQNSANTYLSALEVVGQTLNPEFNKEEMYYTVVVPTDMENIDIEAEAEDEDATVTGDGTKTLTKNNEIFVVTVTSPEGIVRNYQIVVSKDLDHENLLLTLVPSVGTLDPEFKSATNDYILNVPCGTELITFTGTVSKDATVTGLDTIALTGKTMKHTITVTSVTGVVNTYTIDIVRELSTNTKLKEFTPSSGSLEYSNDILEYEMEVGDEINIVSFKALPEDENATISNTILFPLLYGENEIKIMVTAEDGVTTREITVIVTRKKNLISITPNKEKVLLDVDEEETITYTLDPTDTSYPEVEFKSLDESIATIDETGKITGISYGSTSVKIVSKKDASIYANIIVNVVSKKIISDVYTVEHDAEVPYVMGAEPIINVDTFISNFQNNSDILHVYNIDGNEISGNEIVGTGFVIKLIIDEEVYDEVKISIMGDVNGDGYSNIMDFAIINNHILEVVDLKDVYYLAGDVNQDTYINVMDYAIVNNYILEVLESYFK